MFEVPQQWRAAEAETPIATDCLDALKHVFHERAWAAFEALKKHQGPAEEKRRAAEEIMTMVRAQILLTACSSDAMRLYETMFTTLKDQGGIAPEDLAPIHGSFDAAAVRAMQETMLTEARRLTAEKKHRQALKHAGEHI